MFSFFLFIIPYYFSLARAYAFESKTILFILETIFLIVDKHFFLWIVVGNQILRLNSNYSNSSKILTFNFRLNFFINTHPTGTSLYHTLGFI
jgi:hypothetical protein